MKDMEKFILFVLFPIQHVDNCTLQINIVNKVKCNIVNCASVRFRAF